jgi:tetratricopeptide (TPR) repeat protein
LVRLLVRLHSGEPGNWSEETLRLSDETIPLLQGMAAHDELAKAWRLIALTHQIAGRLGPAADAIARVIEHARQAGNQRLVARSGLGLSFSALYGPTPAPQAIERCERILADGLVDRQVESLIQCKVAQLHAMTGNFDAARALLRRGRAVLRELGQGVHAASTALDLVVVEMLAGDLPTAEREVRADHAFLEQRGETFYLSTMTAMLALVVRNQGRDDEALQLTRAAEQSAADDDVDAQIRWRSTRAPIIARAGALGEAETLATAAVTMARQTEEPVLLAYALSELAAVLAYAQRTAEAHHAYAEAVDLFSAKGDCVSAARVQDRLAGLSAC